jgi:2-Cys peroxiredoxin 5
VNSQLIPLYLYSMNAWGKSLDADGSSGIRFLGDPDGSFTRALDVEFDSAALLGTNRSKRYALVVKDGKITDAKVEPDNTGLSGESTMLNPQAFVPHAC